jgi:serine phosphatase RsbU (regulator of sigma subunit)
LPALDPAAAARTLPKAAAVGLAMGSGLYLIGLRAVRPAFGTPLVFTVVMWVGFELLGPWLQFRPDDRLSPGALALRESLRGTALYTGLLAIAVVLCRVIAGVNVVSNFAVALITYLIGFCIMSLVGSFHTTGVLANAAKERVENARRAQELEEARALQLAMLPAAAPQVPGLEVAYAMRTAAEVGGDYYDWRTSPDGSLLLAVGDATGHGVRAGLLVVAVKTLFQTEPGGSLAEALRRMSDGVKSLALPRMNMALAFARIERGRARLSAGGMPPVLHFRSVDRTVSEIAVHAPPAGQLRRAAYSEVAVELAPGDRLLFSTDGLAECRGPEDEQLGYARVTEAFKSSAPGTPREVVDALLAAADSFARGRPLDDDLTVVVVGASAS